MRRYTDLVELQEDSCRRFAERPLFGERGDAGWLWTTYAEFAALVDAARAGLAALGVGKGDRVAIVSRNRLEWAAAAYATYGLGATFVPMYEQQRADEWRFILEDSAARVVLAGEHAAGALRALLGEIPTLAHVIAIDEPTGWPELLARGRARPVPSLRPAPESVAGFVYTSGTTGTPKGVMLSHDNLTSNVAAATEVFPVAAEDRTVSFLPWAHSYGQVVELHILLSSGASAAFNRDVAHLADDLAEVHPTILVAVPRIFHKIHDAVTAQIAAKPAAIRALFRAGLRAALKRSAHEGLGPIEALELRLADRLIFAKIRARFGGRLKYAISASASLSREVADFVDALGIPVYEGYGLTETSPVVSTNRPGARRMGTVGQPIPGVTIRIDEAASTVPGEGEIVVYGPNVMLGYHGRPEETARTIDPDGGLRTGDLGHLDDDGFLVITGRIKEQYKLLNGKYVMPAPLEQQLAASPYIAGAMITGANRPYNVALIVIDVAAVKAWAAREGVELGPDPTASAAVHDLIAGEIDRQAAGFRSFERPRGFVMTTEDFSVENDSLTPTLKLKRRNIQARWGAVLDGLYMAATPEATGVPATL
jgi:long-chain acyl-CoA synthetase